MFQWLNRRKQKEKSYRSNDDWAQSLSDPPDEQAVGELRRLLVNGLKPALYKYAPRELDQFVEDVAQDATLKILARIHTFRGESQFASWAMKIAVREGLSEFRRKKWKDKPLDDLAGNNPDKENGEINTMAFASGNPDPDQNTHENMILEKVMDLINNELSPKQKEAITALMIKGIPMTVAADQMGISRNTLYKLIHDARLNLKKKMLAKGMDLDEILREL